jgi:hypothetical protein
MSSMRLKARLDTSHHGPPRPCKDAGAVVDSLTGIHSAMKCLFLINMCCIYARGFICPPQVKAGIGSRYSSWLGAGRPRGRSSNLGRGKIFILSNLSRPVLVLTQPPIQWVPGTLFLRVKRPWREADHSPLTSTDVKNTWIYTSTPQ